MAYENAYQITNPDCVLLPEEICYMNWQKYLYGLPSASGRIHRV